jgi:hypothetical protein
VDILSRILGLQEQKLSHYQAGCGLIDLFSKKYNSLLQQTGIDIIIPLSSAGLFNDVRY